jgi:carboxynorspermidine decarboxylase
LSTSIADSSAHSRIKTIATEVDAPAFVVDERAVAAKLDLSDRLRGACGCSVLYTLKPLVFEFLLEIMKPRLEGFAASSLFEAKSARGVLGDSGSVHITTPGFRADEIAEIDQLCDYIAFNSLSQLDRFGGSLSSRSKTGLRINPQLALIADDRYNPCRKHSKLGAPLDELERELKTDPGLLNAIRGVHFHTNWDSQTYQPLLKTVRRIDRRLPGLIDRLEWFNLGGGYRLESPEGYGALAEAVSLLRDRGVDDVFIEPGTAFARELGFYVAEVIDLFASGGKTVAVLDTTINHFPECFEYQYKPVVLGDDDRESNEYVLAGSSCLAGDVFGRYRFAEPLGVGSRLVFPNAGSYSIVKSHMFNGINLPTIYSIADDDRLIERRRFTYHDFASRFGVNSEAVV